MVGYAPTALMDRVIGLEAARSFPSRMRAQAQALAATALPFSSKTIVNDLERRAAGTA